MFCENKHRIFLRIHFFFLPPIRLHSTFVYDRGRASFPRTSSFIFFFFGRARRAHSSDAYAHVCACLPPNGTLKQQRRGEAGHSSWRLRVRADGAAQTKHTHQRVLVAFDKVLEGCGDLIPRLCFLEISVHRAVLLLRGGQECRGATRKKHQPRQNHSSGTFKGKGKKKQPTVLLSGKIC